MKKTIIFLLNGHQVANPHELQSVEGMTRNDVVPYYRYLVLTNVPDKEVVRVNQLILQKWSPSGLLYIKDKAWKNIPFKVLTPIKESMKTESTKAYQIDLNRISEGFLYSPVFCHAKTKNEAKSELLKKVRHDGMELLYSKGDLSYLNIPVVRYKEADLIENVNPKL